VSQYFNQTPFRKDNDVLCDTSASNLIMSSPVPIERQRNSHLVSKTPQWRYTRLTQTWVMNFGGDSGASSGRAWLTGPRSSSFSFSPLIPSGNCESRTISRLAVMWTNYSKCTATNDCEHKYCKPAFGTMSSTQLSFTVYWQVRSCLFHWKSFCFVQIHDKHIWLGIYSFYK
jgi:hypothetical protein